VPPSRRKAGIPEGHNTPGNRVSPERRGYIEHEQPVTAGVPAREAELYFERGGPTFRLMQRLHVIKGEGPSVARRILVFLALTWLPLLAFSLFEGRALGPTPRGSFLLDYATYARFFLSLPLLFIADAFVGPRLRSAALHFGRSGLVRAQDAPALDRAIAFFGAWNLSLEKLYHPAGAPWNSLTLPDGSRSMAGVWYIFVAVPLLQFLLFRWIWRLLIWTLFLRDLRRIGLDLVPTHADQAAGLGFLGNVQVSLAIFALALGCVLSADAAFRIRFEAADIKSFTPVLGVYLAVTLIICLGPLLLFSRTLARARLQALRRYGELVNRYNLAFDRKWAQESPPPEPLLGSPDIQSLADLGVSYSRIEEMRPVPFSRRNIVQIAVTAALPVVPLLFLIMPVGDILKLMRRALL
jgi:hypothetical protein